MAYIRGRQSIAEIVSAMKPQFIKSDIVEKMEMLKSYSIKFYIMMKFRKPIMFLGVYIENKHIKF